MNNNRYYIHERTNEGFVRDGHGNLNVTKIFLNNSPIITDRVIVNDEQRKVDILFDITLLISSTLRLVNGKNSALGSFVESWQVVEVVVVLRTEFSNT